MATFVLIHGARVGGWSRERVIPFLEKAGHKAVAPDMPRYVEGVTTLKDYVDRVLEVVDKQTESVILVGHSMGGQVITQAAEYRSEKIRKLVYVCAFLLKDGESLPSRGGGHHNPHTDAELRELLFTDCSDEDFSRAKALLGPPPAGIAAMPIRITKRNFGRIPRVYIECLRDKAILPETQKEMYTDSPCERVFTMDTGHMPLLSRPEELAKCLLAAIL